MKRVLQVVLVIAPFTTALSAPATSDQYPLRTVNVICANPAGAGSDLVTRIVVEKLSERLGQRFVVENRPGASGTIAAEIASRADADGYTLLAQPISFIMAPLMLPNTRIDVFKAFAPIVMMAQVPMVFAVHASLPVRNVGQFVAHAKANPGSIAYASAGIGTPQHLLGELLKRQAGIDILHVPYKGAASGIVDTVAGHVKSIMMGLAGGAAYVKSGQLIPLAVASDRRTEFLPDLPTMAEQGINGVAITAWFGILAPAGTPSTVVQRLNIETNAIMQLPDVRQRFRDLGLEVVGGSPEAFAASMRHDYDRFEKILREEKIQKGK